MSAFAAANALGVLECGLRGERDAHVAAGHLFGQGIVQDCKERGRDVAERAVSAQAVVRGVFGDVNERDGVGGVGSVRAAGDGVAHELGVAVNTSRNAITLKTSPAKPAEINM